MRSPSRFPLVLQASLHSLPAPYSVAERLGISPFRRHVISDPTRPGRDVGLVIGPRESWFNADRANRLQTDEALRVLRDEHSIEQIGAKLLANVPECQGSIKIFGVDWDNPWAIGRHPEMLWFWHFESLFRVLDTPAPAPPTAPTPPAPTAPTPADSGPAATPALTPTERQVMRLYAEAAVALAGTDPPLELPTVKAVYDWLVTNGGYDGELGTFRKALARARRKTDRPVDRVPRSAVPKPHFYGR
jgi:hypothetical protein